MTPPILRTSTALTVLQSAQSQEAENEQHDNDYTYDIENTIHVTLRFFKLYLPCDQQS